MAKESSFDVVSNVDFQEADNAFQQAARELTSRYDLKQTGATLEFAKKDGVLLLTHHQNLLPRKLRMFWDLNLFVAVSIFLHLAGIGRSQQVVHVYDK